MNGVQATTLNSASDSNHALVDGSFPEQQRRSLYGLGSALCSLTVSTYLFARDPSTGLYADVFGNATYVGTILQGGNVTVSANGTVRDDVMDVSTLNKTDLIDVRVCWCTQYLERPYEYCPAEMNTCIVRGKTGPVTCFRIAAQDNYVRSFWPVAFLWIVALLFSLFCTDSGMTARQYARRSCHCRCISAWCKHNPQHEQQQETGADEAFARDLDQLLANQPERAASMYRHYVLQERRRQIRAQVRQEKWWYQMYGNVARRFRRRPTLDTEEGTTAEVASGHVEEAGATTAHDANHSTTVMETGDATVTWDATVIDPRSRQRLALKTKLYRAAVHGDERITSSAADESSTGATSDAAGNHTWSLPTLPFRRGGEPSDNVTLEEMDDEMEHGTRCAFCLVRLREGDVIGDIPCDHCMHKDCLKDWLRRKNRCPLCQQAGIALFQYSPQNHQHQAAAQN